MREIIINWLYEVGVSVFSHILFLNFILNIIFFQSTQFILRQLPFPRGQSTQYYELQWKVKVSMLSAGLEPVFSHTIRRKLSIIPSVKNLQNLNG